MIKVITSFVAITETATSVVIMVMHILLVQKLKESKKNIRKSKSDGDSNTALILQLVVITTSNIICWFPTNGIYIAAMFLSTNPIDVIIWSTVVVLPINSILNPSVFIIISVRKYIMERSKATDLVGNQVLLRTIKT